MNLLPVSFEGGPILIGSPGCLANWQGADAEDYNNLCEIFDREPMTKVHNIPNLEGSCYAVDFGGAGTIYAVENNFCLVLIRAWPNDPDSNTIYLEALESGHAADEAGYFSQDLDTVAVAWAVERLVGLPQRVAMPIYPELDFSIEESVLLYPLNKGKYRWEFSEFEVPGGSVIRFIVSPSRRDSSGGLAYGE